MQTIDTYLANIDPKQRAELERIRALIKAQVPDAEEVITYGMPGFKFNKKYLIACAAFKNHMSLFPGSEAIHRLGDQLKGYKTSKGTIQFTLDKPLSDAVIIAVVKDRVADIKRT